MRVARLLTGLLAVLLLASSSAWAAAREYEIKAAFIYNFALFIEWPPGLMQGNLVVGVLGHDDYGDALDELTSHTVAQNHVVVKRIASLDEAAQCQILVVSPSEAPRYSQIFSALRGKSVLTIGETPGFAAQGGCIGFVPYRSRLRFEINTDALKQGNLKASAKLLSLATIVTGH
ncbi:MAG TPA: YfiR family protein [Candidatus Xenobia bacterium]|jgi:hypothetical protein